MVLQSTPVIMVEIESGYTGKGYAIIPYRVCSMERVVVSLYIFFINYKAFVTQGHKIETIT